MRRSTIVELTTLLCAVLVSPLAAQEDLKPYSNQPLGTLWTSPEEVPVTGEFQRNTVPIDEMMLKFLVDHQVPGATLAISKGSRLVYARGFGFSDIENQLAMPADAQMRLASVSKPITGAAIMQLVDQGKLSLDTKVFQHYPLADQQDIVDSRLLDITVLHLLRHRAGFDRDVSYDPMFIERQVARFVDGETPVDPQEIIKYMVTQKLDFDPGSRFAYSNYGYSLLGRVIEQETGQRYEDYVKENLLKPLGIETMGVGFTLPDKKLDQEPRYYMRKGETVVSLFDPTGPRVPYPYGRWSVQTMDAHGGWVGSAIDLVKFASAFNQPKRCKILSADAIASMFRPPDLDFDNLDSDARGNKRFYAGGWNMLVFKNNQYNTFHGGLFSGTSTLLVRRYDGFCWAVLFNSSQTAGGDRPSSVIDSLIHQAVDAVKKW